MIKRVNKNLLRKKRSLRTKDVVKGTADRPRLSVHRTLTNIYAQIIDDEQGVTLASASTITKDLKGSLAGKTKQEAAFIVGEQVAKVAKKKGVKKVVFDRAGYLYTGRVKSLAEGARKAGLDF